MKRISFLAAIGFIALQLCGCANDQYAIEKEYWKIHKQSESIFAMPNQLPQMNW